MKGPLPRESFYRNESPSKKIVRRLFWKELQVLLGGNFYKTKFLVLPSMCVGDVAALRGLGVPPGNIYGVDIDKHAVAAAEYRYPNSNFAHCTFWEAFNTFPELKKGVGCAFFDLCCPLRDAVLDKIFEASKYVQYVGIEGMYGREKGELLQDLNLTKGLKQQVEPRLDYLQQRARRGRYYNAHRNWHYCSHSAGHYGKPMLVSLGHMSNRRHVNTASTWIEATQETIMTTCLANPDLAQEYNVSQGTIAAWRAHKTRGTYR